MRLLFGKKEHQDIPVREPQAGQPGSIEAKQLPPLPLCFMLSHLEEDGPVRLDGVKLGICEVMGLEMDQPKMVPSPAPSTPWTSRCSCWCASTRPAWTAFVRTSPKSSPMIYRHRRRRPRSRFSVC